MDSTNINRQTWRWFITIAKPFFVSEARWKALGLLTLLISLSILLRRLEALMADVSGWYMTALAGKHGDEFLRYILMFISGLVIIVPIEVMYRFTEEKMSLFWRKWLAQFLIFKYFQSHSYYRINVEKKIDNPDQRIADEVRSFTSTSLSFLLILFNSLVSLYFFLGILLSISAQLTTILLIYAFGGTALTVFIGKRLVALNFIQLRKEADFRYGLIHVRDNSEAIAFCRGEDKEATQVRHRLRDALRNLNFLIIWHRNLGFFTKGYNRVATILPVVIVGQLYLGNEIEFGRVTTATIAFNFVLDAVSLIIGQFERLSAFAASIARLGSFWDAISGERQTDLLLPTETIKLQEGPQIKFENVTVLTPDRSRMLIENLSGELGFGQRLLITGPSGVGKSSLFRVVAGLWNAGSGVVTRPNLDDLMFLPQRPYMVLGSLRNQLRYSLKEGHFSDTRLREVLEQVHLPDLPRRIGGFDVELDWLNLLSLGEQQRITFARVLLGKPRIVFLDESTTALDLESESQMYELLRKSTETFVSIGHRQNLFKHHDFVLEFLGDGHWRLQKIDAGGK